MVKTDPVPVIRSYKASDRQNIISREIRTDSEHTQKRQQNLFSNPFAKVYFYMIIVSSSYTQHGLQEVRSKIAVKRRRYKRTASIHMSQRSGAVRQIVFCYHTLSSQQPAQNAYWLNVSDTKNVIYT